MHKYEKLAKTALRMVWIRSFNWRTFLNLTPEDRRECEREAVEAMCKAASRFPRHAENDKYMIVVGRNRILQFLFGGSHDVKRYTGKGLLLAANVFYFDSSDGWLIKPSMKYDPDDFIDKNLGEIFSLLLTTRKKQGNRGAEAAARDTQIVRLASLGWSSSEIGAELGISADNVKKYRQRIIAQLTALAKQKQG